VNHFLQSMCANMQKLSQGLVYGDCTVSLHSMLTLNTYALDQVHI
jgi:hypothetical protein